MEALPGRLRLASSSMYRMLVASHDGSGLARTKKYLSEDGYDLSGLDGTKIGRIGVGSGNMWGFSPYLRRRGGEAGDYMKVSFNLSDKTALAELSEEPFEEVN